MWVHRKQKFLSISDGVNQANTIVCYLTSDSGMVILHSTQKKIEKVLRDRQNRRRNKEEGF